MKRREVLVLAAAAIMTTWVALPSEPLQGGDPAVYKADVIVLFTPEDHATVNLRQVLDSAKKEIAVGMFTFTNRDLAEALVKAKKRGVKVRVLIDKNQAEMKYSQAADLKSKGVDLVEVSLGQTGNGMDIRYHNKFAVVDRDMVVTGSFNWTMQADEENYENLLVMKSPKLAEAFMVKFDEHWEKFAKK